MIILIIIGLCQIHVFAQKKHALTELPRQIRQLLCNLRNKGGNQHPIATKKEKPFLTSPWILTQSQIAESSESDIVRKAWASEASENDVCRNDQGKLSDFDQRFIGIVGQRHVKFRDEHFFPPVIKIKCGRGAVASAGWFICCLIESSFRRRRARQDDRQDQRHG